MEIKLLLEKYKKIGFSQKRIKEIFITVSKKFILELKEEDVEVKDSQIKLNISGTKRTHFVLVREKMFKELEQELSKEGLKITKIF